MSDEGRCSGRRGLGGVDASSGLMGPGWLLLTCLCACTGADGPLDDSAWEDTASMDTGEGPIMRLGACDLFDAEVLDRAAIEGDPQTLEDAATLGMTLGRPHRPGGPVFSMNLVHPSPGSPADYTLTDLAVQTAGAYGLALFGTLLPEGGAEPVPLPNPEIPDDQLEAWLDFVRDLTERYDGDGVEDMPGLAVPVVGWELGNEPRCYDEDCRARYTELLRLTHAAAHEAHDGIILAPGGTLPAFMVTEDMTLMNREFYRAIVEAGVPIDALAFHMFVGAAEPPVEDHVEAWREVVGPDVPLWLTETGVRSPDGRQQVADTPQGQAEWMTANVQGALDSGVEVVLWCRAQSAYSEVPEVYEAVDEFF